jgi:hypothetical protein
MASGVPQASQPNDALTTVLPPLVASAASISAMML